MSLKSGSRLSGCKYGVPSGFSIKRFTVNSLLICMTTMSPARGAAAAIDDVQVAVVDAGFRHGFTSGADGEGRGMRAFQHFVEVNRFFRVPLRGRRKARLNAGKGERNGGVRRGVNGRQTLGERGVDGRHGVVRSKRHRKETKRFGADATRKTKGGR